MRSPSRPSSASKGQRLEISQASEARALAPPDISGVVVWECDPESFAFSYISEGVVEMLGYPVLDWLSRPGLWLEIVHPEDREAAVHLRKLVVSRGEEQEIEYRVATAEGGTRWVRDRAAIVTEAGVKRLRGVMLDVTAAKLAEQRLVAQNAVTRALAESETLAEAAPRILRAVCETLEWQLGALWTVDDELDLLICEEVWRSEDTGAQFEELTREIAFPRGIGMPGRAWESGGPIWVSDVVRDSNFPRAPAAATEGLHGALAFPISLSGRVIGVIEFFSNQIRERDERLLSMFGSVGTQIGQFVERQRMHDELRGSERELADFVETANIGMRWVGPDGTILWANQAELEMLGYGRDEYVGRNISFFHVDQQVIADILDRLTQGETIQKFEASMVAKDGSIKHVVVDASVLWENGRFVHTRCLMRDVTHSKQVEEALREAEERYRGIVENAGFGVFQTTRDRRFITANDALARILGYESPKELVECITDIASQVHVDPQRRVEFARILEETGFVHNFEAQAYRKDGSVIWISLSARALRNHDGTAKGYEGILADVTPRLRAEQAFNENEFRYRTIFDTAGVSLWEEDFTAARAMLDDLRAKGVKDLPRYLQQHPEFVEEAIASVRILDVNEYSVRLFGAKDKAELMHALNDIFLPETREAFLEELLVLDSASRFFQSETVVKRLDGQRLHVLFTIAFPDEPSLLNHVMVSRTDITERKLEEQRQQFLAEASDFLSSSLDYETTLDNVARLVADRLGDLCSIDLVDDGEVRRVALAHADPAKEALFADMEPTYRPPSQAHPVLRAVATGGSELVNGIPEETLRLAARDEKHLRALRSLQMKSVMVIPLSVGKKVLGAITIASSEDGRKYTRADLALAEELSRRAGIAIDNAQLYEAREQALEGAQAAADRTAGLQAVTASLSEAVTPTEVGAVVAQAAIAALNARSVFIATLSEAGVLKGLAAEGVSEEFKLAWFDYAAAPPVSIVQAIRLGRPVFAASREVLLEQFPALATLPIMDDRSFACAPLVVEGRAIGSMVLTFAKSRALLDEERELVLALGRLCAQALERARLYDATENALVKAETATRQQTFLSKASAILASSLECQTTLGSVAELCVPELADWCAIDVRDEDGSFRRVAVVHSDPEQVALAAQIQERYPPDYERGFVSSVIKSGQPLLYTEVSEQILKEIARDDEHFNLIMGLGIKSGLVVPLAARGRTLGLLTLLTAESDRKYAPDDLDLAQELGRRAGIALDNSLLYDAAQRAHEAAEAAHSRQAFLAEASSILASSLDYQTTLAQVAELCVPGLADWCAIDVSDEGGSINHVAVVHQDPEKVEIGRQLREKYATDYEGGIAKQVFGSGKSFFWPELSTDLLARAAKDERHLDLLHQLGLKSVIVVPLTAREKTFGMLTLAMAESERRYSEDDLTVAQEVARRSAVAIDNARLYSSEQLSRTEAEEAQQRLWFLAEANAVLSSSLDFETTLSRVATLAVPWLADCCVAHLFSAEGVEARAAVCHVDPAKEDLVRELHANYAPRADEPHPIMEMIRSQSPVLMEDIQQSVLADIIRDDRHRDILEQLDFKSYMVAPLIARGRLFGALTFGTTGPERRYSRQDLSLAEELARRAALALDNARLYDESQRVQDALRVALEAKDEFLGVMSHELRTPITAIYGGARVLRSRAERLDDESKGRLLEDIEQESERLFRMVENLLVLSRLELGQEVSTEPVLVQRLVAKLEAAFRQRRPGRSLAIDIDDRLAPVAAEPHYLEQILRNLLSNADKYSPVDSPIEIAASSQDGLVNISVLDRGPGIDPEEIELIFDRFYRSDRTATQAAGIGLGLTVCKRLAEAQAGRIWARSRQGGGLQVGITLPLCKEV